MDNMDRDRQKNLEYASLLVFEHFTRCKGKGLGQREKETLGHEVCQILKGKWKYMDTCTNTSMCVSWGAVITVNTDL